MSKFKHDVGVHPKNITNLAKQLVVLGYDNCSISSEDIYIKSYSNGEFASFDDTEDLAEHYEVDNEDAFLAIAAIREDNEYHVGEHLILNEDQKGSHLKLKKGDIIKVTRNYEYAHNVGQLETWIDYEVLKGEDNELKRFSKTSRTYRNLTRKMNPEEIIEFYKNKQNMKTYTVDKEFILEGYSAACDGWKTRIKEKFPEVFPKSITDRIKTFKDVEAVVGKVLLPYANPSTKQQVSTNAFVKIQYISKVLNEGWAPDFNNSKEYKWYPWFEKKGSGWGLCGVSYYYVVSVLGSDFSYKSEELARHAATQFLDIYKEYLPE